MRLFCTSRNRPRFEMVYLGQSFLDAEAAVGTFAQFQRGPDKFPKQYQQIFTALPKEIDFEIIAFYEVNALWYSIVKFDI